MSEPAGFLMRSASSVARARSFPNRLSRGSRQRKHRTSMRVRAHAHPVVADWAKRPGASSRPHEGCRASPRRYPRFSRDCVCCIAGCWHVRSTRFPIWQPASAFRMRSRSRSSRCFRPVAEKCGATHAASVADDTMGTKLVGKILVDKTRVGKTTQLIVT